MSPRPRQTDKDIVEKAVRERLWPRCHEWLKQGGWTYGDDPDEVDQCIKELVGAVQYERDGYRAARYLDDWEPDTELVDILDSFSVYDAHQKAVEAWVAETKPTTTFKVGDAVTVREGPLNPWKQGVIDKVDEKHATFRVRVPSEGHQPAHVGPDRKTGIVVHGWDVPWEDVRPTSGAVPSP